MEENDLHEINKYWEKYSNEILAIASQRFEATVKPFCKKKGFIFLSGNCDWYILGKDMKAREDEVPAYITELLDQEVPGMPTESLGTLMPCYDPKSAPDHDHATDHIATHVTGTDMGHFTPGK